MKKILAIATIIFLTLACLDATAKPNGNLTGKITDKETGEPIIGATIRLQGTSIGQFTNREGIFSLKSIPSGKYTLIISSVGYESQKVDVYMLSEDITIEVEMRPKTLISSEIVVTANKKVQTVQEVPISLSIVKGNIFREKSISKLDNALKYVPGVEVNNDNVSIRGSSGFAFGLGSRAIMLLDGFPMLSGDNGDIKSDAIPFPLIDQIEIIKGAGSALYGASALGGVINLITKEPTEKAYFTASSQFGLYTQPKYKSWQFSDGLQATRGANFGYSQRFAKVGISLAGSYISDDGYRFYNEENRFMLYGKSSIAITELSSLSLSGLAAVSNRDDWVYWNSLDSATRPPTNTDLDNKITASKYSINAEYKQIISANDFMIIKTNLFATQFENKLKGDEYRQSDAKTYNTEVQYNTKLHQYFNLTAGANYAYNQVEARTYGKREQNTLSLYSQIESPLGDLIFTYGGRFDLEQTKSIQKSLAGGRLEFSPKLGMAYRTKFNSTIRTSIGKGFRPASIAERFASLAFQGFEVVPNIKLKHERSVSFEVGWNQPVKIDDVPLIIDASIYNNELFNMIEPKFVQGTKPSIQFLNTTRARITGMEFNIKTMISSGFGMEYGISAMLPKDLDSNTTLKYRSAISLLARYFYKIGDFEIYSDYRFKSKPEKVDDELKLQIKNHDARVAVHLLDAGIKYKNKSFAPIELSIYASNLLDYYYTEVPGNLGRTRTIFFSVSYLLD